MTHATGPDEKKPVAARISDVWGARTPYGAGQSWPERVDIFLRDEVAASEVDWVPSACLLCSNGCGIDIAVKDGRMVGVRGRGNDRVNRDRLGPKGCSAGRASCATGSPRHSSDGRIAATGVLERGPCSRSSNARAGCSRRRARCRMASAPRAN